MNYLNMIEKANIRIVGSVYKSLNDNMEEVVKYHKKSQLKGLILANNNPNQPKG